MLPVEHPAPPERRRPGTNRGPTSARASTWFVGGCPSGLASIGDEHAAIVMADGTRHVTTGLEAALR